MIALALVMMRVRRAHAATVWALATLAIAAAVAAPLYVRAAQRSITDVDVAAATPDQQTITTTVLAHVREDPDDPRSSEQVAATQLRAFDRKATEALTIPGFVTVFAAGFDISVGAAAADLGDSGDPRPAEQALEFRDGVCGHITVVSGRCAVGPGEVVVGADTADKRGLRPGTAVHVQAMQLMPATAEGPGMWRAVGDPAVLSVVGVYRKTDAADVFWTSTVSGTGAQSESLFTNRRTVAAVDHPTERQAVVAYPGPRLHTSDAFASIRGDVEAALARAQEANAPPVTSILELINKIDRDRAQVAVTPAVASIPLIMLCCFVVLLTAANTAQVRRVEMGMLKLRGTSATDQFWLASAEIVLPLVAGAVTGYLLGQVGVWLLAGATLANPLLAASPLAGSPPLSVSTDVLPQAAAALLATIAAGLIGLRRDLSTPVAELLRRVPSRSGHWGGLVVRTLVVILAVAVVIQVRTGGSSLSGVALLAPALVVLAVALVIATLFDPLSGRWGRRALRRGRLGTALAMLHLGRRRSGSRVLAMLIVAVGLVSFAATAYETGTGARHDQVRTSIGAHRVVSVGVTSTRTLLAAVRAVDPDGSYAMAAMSLGKGNGVTPPVLAVDSPRLAAAAFWPTGGLSAAQVAAALRPKVSEPVTVRGTGLELTATLATAAPAPRVTVTAVVAPLDGSLAQPAVFGTLRKGTHSYVASAPCTAGCRITQFVLSQFDPVLLPDGSSVPVTVTFSGLRQTGPDAALVSVADFGSWENKFGAAIDVQPTEAGFAVKLGLTDTSDAKIGPTDTPTSLPAVAAPNLPPIFNLPLPPPIFTGPRPQTLSAVVVTTKALTPVLPRLGSAGALVDMEYLTRFGEPGLTQLAEVWLGLTAPADTVDRLRTAGLLVVGERDVDHELRTASNLPNAVGLQFLIVVGLLCLALGAGGLAVAAAVELPVRAQELRALRGQGVPRRVVARAGRLSYLFIVAVGAVGGAVAALAAWVATGDRLPLVDVLVAGLPAARWPGLTTAWIWSISAVVLAAVGVILSLVLSRGTRPGRNRR